MLGGWKIRICPNCSQSVHTLQTSYGKNFLNEINTLTIPYIQRAQNELNIYLKKGTPSRNCYCLSIRILFILNARKRKRKTNWKKIELFDISN